MAISWLTTRRVLIEILEPTVADLKSPIYEDHSFQNTLALTKDVTVISSRIVDKRDEVMSNLRWL